MNEIVIVAVWSVISYLIGTISVGDIVARAAGVDIRTRGTKNPGAANIYRELGPKYGVIVFVLDIAKGILMTVPLLLLGLPAWARLAAAVAVVLGHIFPVFTSRAGGTGMSTAIGSIAGLAPLGAAVGAPIGMLILLVARNAGYTGAVFFAVTALCAWLFAGDIVSALGVLFVAAIVLIKSRVQYGGG